MPWRPTTVPGSAVVPPAPALELAHAAAARLLQRLRFGGVQRDRERVASSTPVQTEGYILTRFADKYGRAVSFAYAGTSDHADLSSVLSTSNCWARV